ncbi:MAG: hypothetical protein GW779_00425 [Candidatus Altiarchaeum hamiconexum]|uniref:Uncharacterized protein n=1 Tax=Candidatus Altarchaeum hamiconexum TaxID=1803513 RepID=A0A8J8CIZ2_9ARCH|nr:hypothetical protein [Candidatus Altarchaeum hamiconexum]NCN69250.1 hypothetical protein [Candidatus Altarchaeum hamiconexum]NCS90879.1 hypothetical protein [Candidatus Altarchaeum hamiconexum]NCT00735.1 hypothetical protein [Candidatus Altarchaeum hamiconexum]
MFVSQRKPKTNVPDSPKANVEKICNEFVESFLNPQYIKPPPKDNKFGAHPFKLG